MENKYYNTEHGRAILKYIDISSYSIQLYVMELIEGRHKGEKIAITLSELKQSELITV